MKWVRLVLCNKSTASGAIYARNSVIFPRHCQGEVDAVKRGPKLNLIKKIGERGGGRGSETKTVCQTVSNEVKYKNSTIYTM